MKLPFTRNELDDMKVYNEKSFKVLQQAKLAIDLAERLEAAERVIEAMKELHEISIVSMALDGSQYGKWNKAANKLHESIRAYDSLTQEGKRKE